MLSWGVPGGSAVKRPPAIKMQETTGLIPDPGGSLGATKAYGPQLLSPGAATTEACAHTLEPAVHKRRGEGNRRDGQGSPDGGNRLQVSDVFSLSLKWQEETNYTCQPFSLLCTKLKGLKFGVAMMTPGST